jgi:2'-5' RNA ligase
MLPGDRLVCCFTSDQAVGVQFKKWLLHVTIVPWFRLDDRTEQIATGLAEALTAVAPFETEVGETSMFGPRKNRPAHLLEPARLPEVEQRVRSYLHKKRAWLVDETTRRKRTFKPHVTYQGDYHLEEGGMLEFRMVYIVEQKGEYKEITAEIPLGKRTA